MADDIAIPASVWEDLETLVFERDDVHAALPAALEALPDESEIPVDASALRPLPSDDDDAWLATIPAAAFDVLMRASRPRSADAPRLPFAVARPIESRAA